MNQYSDDNGCTCAAAGLARGTCIACRSRSAAASSCKDCGIGLMPGNDDEIKNRQCSNCYWNDR